MIPEIPIRASMLPKLAQCAKYESSSNAGPAAARGTAMDTAFRMLIQDGTEPQGSSEDVEAIKWAADESWKLADGSALLAAESDLRVESLGVTGTADLCCPDRMWSADLKTGQIRGYYEQMALYALGFMDRYFCDTWTTYLLFCDQRHVTTHQWTREHAEQVVRDIVSTVKDSLTVATPCDYCDWCSLRWTCQTRLAPLSMLLMGAPDKLDLATIKSCPADLGALMDLTYEIAKDDGLHDELRSAATEHCVAGRAVPGWKLSPGRETSSVKVDQILQTRLLQDAGPALLQQFNSISGAKFTAVWQQTYGTMPPEGMIQTNHGSAFVSKASRKKSK